MAEEPEQVASDEPEQVAATEGSAPEKRRRRPGPLAGAVLGGLAVLFAVLNSQSVQMNWIVTTTKTPLIVVIVVFTLIGFAGGLIFARVRRRR